MAKENNCRCNFNHSVNVILFLMFFIVLIAVAFNGCLGTCKDKQNEQTNQTEQIVSEQSVNKTAAQDSLVAN